MKLTKFGAMNHFSIQELNDSFLKGFFMTIDIYCALFVSIYHFFCAIGLWNNLL